MESNGPTGHTTQRMVHVLGGSSSIEYRSLHQQFLSTTFKLGLQEVRDTDRYGRKVAFVNVNGQDINLKMIEDGYAWWYERYGPNNITYKKAQQQAKANKRALWSEKDPVAPWDWRRSR